MPKFPYKVFFKVDEEQKIVYVEAIISDYLLPFSTKIKGEKLIRNDIKNASYRVEKIISINDFSQSISEH